MNNEQKFLLKVLRNSFILSGLYFVSVFASGSLSWQICRPIVVFFTGYIFTELARRYGVTFTKIPLKNKKAETLIW